MDAALHYQPDLIEEHATDLFVRAQSARLVWSVVGGAGGAAAGLSAVIVPSPLPLPARLGIWAIAVLAGVLAGRRLGRRRARTLRVQAQLTLSHVHSQYGTLAVWRTLRERLPEAAAAWERAQMQPAPPPVSTSAATSVPPEIAERVAQAVAAAAETPLSRAVGDV